jgi:hypothetical protein
MLDEAPGAETLGHNQSTEKSNLAAFDLDEEASEGRPYICLHAKKGRFECHANSSYEAAKKAAQKWGMKNTAGIDAHLADIKHSTASLGEAEQPTEEKLTAALKNVEAKIEAEKNPQLKMKLTHKKEEIEAALKQLKDQPKKSTKSSSNNPLSRLKGDVDDASKSSGGNDENFWKAVGKLAIGLGESRMAEADSIIQDIINGDLDAYDVMTNPKTPEEEYVANMMQEMYDDVSIDYRLHPDDDFEEILDIIVDRLEKDHKHDDNQPSMFEEEVSEDLDANQKRVGQLGPTEKVGPKGAVGKLVGASESIERDPLDDLRRLLGN